MPKSTVANRPFGYLDAQGRVIPKSFYDETYRGEFSGTLLIYKGFARPGSVETDPVWQIAKCTYDASNNLINIKWPENALGEASNDYEFQWSARAGYTYV